MKLFSKILLLSFGMATTLISMNEPQLSAFSLNDQESQFSKLTKNNAQELRILVAKEQRGIYCPELYKAQTFLKSFLTLDNMAWLFIIKPNTNNLVGKIADKSDGCNKLISIFNGEVRYKNLEDLSLQGQKLLQENRYIAHTYSSCAPYEDRIIQPLHYTLAKHAHGLSHHYNTLEFCRILLHFGANSNARDDANNTPLHHASTTEQVHLLCDYGADLNKKGEHGRTPLLNSIRLCNWPVATCLLEYGANPNKQDDKGNTPLYKAIKKKSCSTFIQLLLDKGADCTLRNRKSKAGADIANDTTRTIIMNHMIKIITQADVSEILLEKYMFFYDLYFKKA